MRYVDSETGLYLADHVGRCNREAKCGHHFTPKEYFSQVGSSGTAKDDWRASEAWRTVYTPPPLETIPLRFVKASKRHIERNNLAIYLASLFGWQKTRELAKLYELGTSKHWRYAEGLSVVFWQIDKQGSARQAKVMPYDPVTGCRIKSPDGLEVWHKRDGRYQAERNKPGAFFAGKRILQNVDANLQQCFFGEHLLAVYPQKPVALVESEKTAIIMAGYFNDCIWLATGGNHGAKWTDSSVYDVLENRRLVVYPDTDKHTEWKGKAKLLATVCEQVEVSDLLIENTTPDERHEGYDIADFIISKESRTGLPAGFTMVDGTVEVDSLPINWLNEEELTSAQQRAEEYGMDLSAFKIKP